MIIAASYLLIAYILGWSFENSVYSKTRTAREREIGKMELLLSKVAVLFVGIYFAMTDVGMGFVIAIVNFILFIPIRRLYGFKFLMTFGLLGFVGFILYQFEPYRILKIFQKGARMKACLGQSPFFSFIVVYSGLVVNCLYVHLKYLFVV